MNIDVFDCFNREFEVAVVAAESIDSVIAEDKFQYELCACTWFALLDEYSDLTDFLDYFGRVGFYHTIDDASKLSFSLMTGAYEDIETYPVELQSIVFDWVDGLEDGEPSQDDIWNMVSLLRWPKRLCVKDEETEGLCIREFVEHNRKCGAFNNALLKTELPEESLGDHIFNMVTNANSGNNLRTRVLERMKYWFTKWFGFAPVFQDGAAFRMYNKSPEAVEKRLDDCSWTIRKLSDGTEALRRVSNAYDDLFIEDFTALPTGVCADGKTAVAKLRQLVLRNPLDYPGHPFSLSYWTGRAYTKCDRYVLSDTRFPVHDKPFKYFLNDEVHYGEVMSVPKTYKESRIVVKEQSFRLSSSKKLANLMARVLKRISHGMVDVNDQTINREQARIGSIDGSLATIDWHHASDGYVTEIVKRIMPKRWFEAISKVRAEYLWVNGTVYVNNIFLTMGHTLTPCVQSALFYALCMATADIGELYFGIKVDRKLISVYNDDTVIPSELAELLNQCGTSIGLEMNLEKSFSTGYFREACGGEYYLGQSVGQHLYWPRTRIDVKCTADLAKHYDTLVSIQHSVFNKRGASNSICKVLEKVYPNITWSNTMGDATPDPIRRFRTVEHCPAPFERDSSKFSIARTLGTELTGYERDLSGKKPKLTPVTKSLDEITEREVHLCAVGTWPRRKDLAIREAEYLAYITFLKVGPFYEDGLMELLGCSTRRNPVSYAMTEPVIVLSRRRV